MVKHVQTECWEITLAYVVCQKSVQVLLSFSMNLICVHSRLTA